jgi:uncharacterized protein (TIGR02117 family)
MAGAERTRLWRRRLLRALAALLIALIGTPILYVAAAFLLGTVPANAGWSEPRDGIAIFIRTNGVHTWILMPKVTPAMDWRPYAPPEHLADPRWGAASHIAIGYGNREFYLNTPTWGDLTVRRAVGAFVGGGRTLLHVEHVDRPGEDAEQRRILLRPEEYARLVAYVRARFQRDAAGRTMPVLGRGYGPSDMFYEAEGGYSFVMTCNEWTGRALRHAGVRTGLWTPLSQSIMWRLD